MASKAIRGITIEIGGDTSKLGKALEGTEKKTRSLQVELKQVEKLLKFDPGNTELLAQKQKILADMVGETSDKLDTLKKAQEQVTAQFERGDIGADQYRAFQRELIQTEKELKDLEKELSDTDTAIKNFNDGTDSAEKNTKEYKDSLEDAKNELKDFGDKAKDAGEKVGKGILAIGTATVAGAGYALKLSNDFDKAFNTLQTRTGATAEEMVGLNEAMEGVYKNNFGESIEDVAESMAIVKTNTKASNDEVQELTESALLLRDTFGFEVNESTRSAKMLMDQFGISGKQAYNLIAQGAQAGLDKNGDLLDTVNEYAVHYKQLGYTSEEFFNSLINGASSGTFSVDKLGDAMKEFGIRAKDTATTTDEGFQLLGLDADEMREKFAKGGESAREATDKTLEALFNMDDQVKQNQAGVDLFGTMWEDLGIEGVKALMDVTGGASLTSDALDKINEQKYDDIGSALQGLRRTLETDVIDPIGDELKPVVEDAIEYVKDNGPAIKETISNIVTAIGNFVKLIVDNKDAVIATIVAIGAGVLAWKITSIIGGLIPLITSMITAVKGGALAWQALNLAMKANIIGVIIGAITALVAGFIYLWNNCDEFRNFWIGLWEKIKSAFQSFIDWIGPGIEAIKGFFLSLWTKISEIWTNIMESLQPLFDSIIGAFREGWELIKVIWDLVEPYFSAIWENIKIIFSVAKEILGAYFSSAWEAIKLVWSVAVSYFQTIWNNIKLIFSVVKTYLSGMFSTAWVAIEEVWNTAVSFFSAIWKSIAGIFSVVKNVLTGNWRDAWEGIKGIVGTWASFFSGVWSSIKKIFGSVKTWFSSTFSSAWTAIKGVFSNWGSFFSGLWDTIKNTFSKIGTNISEAISNSVKAGINGVISQIEKTINKGIKLINGAIDLINKIPGVDVGKIGLLDLPRLYRGGVLKKGQVGLLEGDGSEAVVPLEQETGWINRIAQKMNEIQSGHIGGDALALSAKMDEMIETMKTLKSTIVLDTGTLVGETINQIDEQLGNNYSLRERRI